MNKTWMKRIIQYAVHLLMIMLMGMVGTGCRHHSQNADIPMGDCLLMIIVPSDDYLPYSVSRSTSTTLRRLTIHLESDGITKNYHTITDKDTVAIKLKLEYGKYKAYVWCDEDISGRIDADALPYVCLPTQDKYTGSTHSLGASLIFDLNTSFISCRVPMSQPMAKIRFIATDSEEAEYSGLTATVSYNGFFPTMFNVSTFSPSDAATGYAFSTPVTSDVIAVDHIFADKEESFVRVDVTVKDQSEQIVAVTSNIKVPYRRGQLTTITGNFLTSKPHGGDGITIDTEWSGEYEIEF